MKKEYSSHRPQWWRLWSGSNEDRIVRVTGGGASVDGGRVDVGGDLLTLAPIPNRQDRALPCLPEGAQQFVIAQVALVYCDQKLIFDVGCIECCPE